MVKLAAVLFALGESQRAGQIGAPNAFTQYSKFWKLPVETNSAPKTVFSSGAKWLPWGAWNACTGVCGNGVQTRVRRCIGGVAGIDCSGETLNSKKCTDFEVDRCSYWSGWGSWSSPSASCSYSDQPARRCKTRTCYGRDTDRCEGPTEFCETLPEIVPDCATSFAILPAERCCDWRNPNCGERLTIRECGPCYRGQQREIIGREPEPLPLCVCPTETEDSEEKAVCKPNCMGRWLQKTRTHTKGELINGAIVWKVVKTELIERKDPNDPECGDYFENPPCNGKVLPDGRVCPGTMVRRRSCECYEEHCKVVYQPPTPGIRASPVPLYLLHPNTDLRTGNETCGAQQPLETVIVLEDRLGQVPMEYVGMAEDQIDAVCSSVCLEAGLKKVILTINPCECDEGKRTIRRELACGIIKPPTEWAAVEQIPCDYPVCPKWGQTIFSKVKWQRTHVCTGKVDTEIRNGEACPATPCGEWSVWESCPTGYPAACTLEPITRTRTCACAGYHLTETDECRAPPVPAPPAPQIGPCLNKEGKSCGWGQQKITTFHHCNGQQETWRSCQVPEEPIQREGPCECPADGNRYSTKLRWTEYQNPECPSGPQFQKEVPCTPNNPWLDWTEWGPESHICANQCYQLRYRCRLCDGKSDATCAAKYGREAYQKMGGCGGDPNKTPEIGACNSKCGNEGTQMITIRKVCSMDVKYESQKCINPYVPERSPAVTYPPVHSWNSKCCRGQQKIVTPAVMDGTNVCEPEQVVYTEIAAQDDYTPGCYTTSEWSKCTQGADQFCFQTRTTTFACGQAKKVEQRPCSLGLNKCYYTGGITGGYYWKSNPEQYCNFEASDVNKCGYGAFKKLKCDPICKNDGVENYTADEVGKVIPNREAMCGLVYRFEKLESLIATTVRNGHPGYEPYREEWGACTATAENPTKGMQTLIRRSLCQQQMDGNGNIVGWKDVTVVRECNPCKRVIPGEWEPCSENCKVGFRQRFNMCISEDGQILDSRYEIYQTEPCDSNPWFELEYGSCQLSDVCFDGQNNQHQCGTGARSVTRVAKHKDMARCGSVIAGLTVSEAPIDCSIVCPYWSAWTEPDMTRCHQKAFGCPVGIPRTRTCEKGSSLSPSACDCQGESFDQVACGINEPKFLYQIDTKDTDCISGVHCPGATYTITKFFECSDSVQSVQMCQGLVDIPGASEWSPKEPCSECDSHTRVLQTYSKCTGLPIAGMTQEEKCTPIKRALPPWSMWDDSDCKVVDGIQCGLGLRKRFLKYSCPQFEPDYQYTQCIGEVVENYSEWSTCSQACWKDESLLAIASTSLSNYATSADACGSQANAYSYMSITAYDNSAVVKDVGAWADPGVDVESRPGWYPGYKGGWQMRLVTDKCAGTQRTEYQRCGTCRCPPRLQRSATAVTCSATAGQFVDGPASCGAPGQSCYSGMAAATATCDMSDLVQPECAHLKDHAYVQGLCNAQVSVSCNAYAREGAWNNWSVCQSADGRTCASTDGEMGTQTRMKACGCGLNCNQATESRPCELPYAESKVWGDWVNVECVDSSIMGRKKREMTTTNMCTGVSTITDVEYDGQPIASVPDSVRYETLIIKRCSAQTRCGQDADFVDREVLLVKDKCHNTQAEKFGAVCKVDVCPYYSAWMSWESCSTSCGEGTRRRIRYCIGGEVGEGYCRPGADGVTVTQTTTCNRGDCCNWEWSGWTGCCFNGQENKAIRYRFHKKCGAEDLQGIQRDCFGTAQENSDQVAAQASGDSASAVVRCDRIGSNKDDWQYFHNPDTLTIASDYSHKFVDLNEKEVTVADSTFAIVSRAYVTAQTRAYSWQWNSISQPAATTGPSKFYGQVGWTTGTTATNNLGTTNGWVQVGGGSSTYTSGGSNSYNTGGSSTGTMGTMGGHVTSGATATATAGATGVNTSVTANSQPVTKPEPKPVNPWAWLMG